MYHASLNGESFDPEHFVPFKASGGGKANGNGTNVKTNSASLDAPSSAEAQAEMENVMAQVTHHGPHAVA
jgi:hypothetical protein